MHDRLLTFACGGGVVDHSRLLQVIDELLGYSRTAKQDWFMLTVRGHHWLAKASPVVDDLAPCLRRDTGCMYMTLTASLHEEQLGGQ